MATKKTKDNKVEKVEASDVKKLADLREKLREIRFKVEGSKSKDVKSVREIKKEIARVLTAINLAYRQAGQNNKK